LTDWEISVKLLMRRALDCQLAQALEHGASQAQ